jgi:hypothetical protein
MKIQLKFEGNTIGHWKILEGNLFNLLEARRE